MKVTKEEQQKFMQTITDNGFSVTRGEDMMWVVEKDGKSIVFKKLCFAAEWVLKNK